MVLTRVLGRGGFTLQCHQYDCRICLKLPNTMLSNTNPLCIDEVTGNTRPQSSQLAKPLWTDPSLKSGINVRELTSTLKKKACAGNKWSNILPKSSQAREKTPQHDEVRFF